MSNQKTYETIDHILGIIEQLSPKFETETKKEQIQRKIVGKGQILFEVNLHEKVYVLADGFSEARKCADLMSNFNDAAGVLTDVEIKRVQSADGISDLVSKDKRPVVPVIDDKGGGYAPCLYTLDEVIPEMFPSKEKLELQKKLEESHAKLREANEQYNRLYEQLLGIK